MSAVETGIKAAWCARPTAYKALVSVYGSQQFICQENGLTISGQPTRGYVVERTGLMTAKLVHGLSKSAPRLAELNHTGLKVVQHPFNEAVLLFVMGQEVMPERMLHAKGCVYQQSEGNAEMQRVLPCSGPWGFLK